MSSGYIAKLDSIDLFYDDVIQVGDIWKTDVYVLPHPLIDPYDLVKSEWVGKKVNEIENYKSKIFIRNKE